VIAALWLAQFSAVAQAFRVGDGCWRPWARALWEEDEAGRAIEVAAVAPPDANPDDEALLDSKLVLRGGSLAVGRW
jgi:hypothetical protein